MPATNNKKNAKAGPGATSIVDESPNAVDQIYDEERRAAKAAASSSETTPLVGKKGAAAGADAVDPKQWMMTRMYTVAGIFLVLVAGIIIVVSCQPQPNAEVARPGSSSSSSSVSLKLGTGKNSSSSPGPGWAAPAPPKGAAAAAEAEAAAAAAKRVEEEKQKRKRRVTNGFAGKAAAVAGTEPAPEVKKEDGSASTSGVPVKDKPIWIPGAGGADTWGKAEDAMAQGKAGAAAGGKAEDAMALGQAGAGAQAANEDSGAGAGAGAGAVDSDPKNKLPEAGGAQAEAQADAWEPEPGVVRGASTSSGLALVSVPISEVSGLTGEGAQNPETGSVRTTATEVSRVRRFVPLTVTLAAAWTGAAVMLRGSRP